MMNYKDFESHARSMGFQSAIDYKYLRWAVENNFPSPLDKLSAKDKNEIREDVKSFLQEIKIDEDKQIFEKLKYSGIPQIYFNSKGKVTDLIEKVPLKAINNFFFIADSFQMMGEDVGKIDPEGTGKTTELCAYVVRSIRNGKLAHYVSSQDLQDGIENESQRNDEPYYFWARHQEILCVDDVGMEKVKYKSNHVEEVLNHRLDNGLKTVISISCSIDKFEKGYPKVAKRSQLFLCALFKRRK